MISHRLWIALLCWIGVLFPLRQEHFLAEELPRSGNTDPRLAPIDTLLEQFATEHQVQGLALALARKGKLVHSVGWGYAEPEGKPGRKTVQPDTLFRIASLSKPITAAAICLLVQRGKLSLEDKVLERISFATPLEPPADPRWRDITLRQLLHHTGGFDRGRSFDPMFRSVAFAKEMGVTPPASTEIIIRAMLKRPLDFDPGTKYAYSNFGYCLLGRVIERASGQSYADFVRRELLEPAGIKDMAIGGSLASQRLPRESHYFVTSKRMAPSVFPPHDPVERPYGSWYQESLDAHGGWVASAEDLVRLSLFWDPERKDGPLTPATWELMRERPKLPLATPKENEPSPIWYGLGWQVREAGQKGHNLWHTGLLPGTGALWVRRHDGFHWVILWNTQGKEGEPPLASRIDPLIHKAIGAVKEWPE